MPIGPSFHLDLPEATNLLYVRATPYKHTLELYWMAPRPATMDDLWRIEFTVQADLDEVDTDRWEYVDSFEGMYNKVFHLFNRIVGKTLDQLPSIDVPNMEEQDD